MEFARLRSPNSDSTLNLLLPDGLTPMAVSLTYLPSIDPAPPPEPLDVKLEKLRFYREEIKHEFNLLSNRVSAYITSQSFLVTGFALSLGNLNPQWGELFRQVFPPMLVLLGLASSILVRPGIQGACDTIGLWHIKQDSLFENDPRMQEYRVLRCVVPCGQSDPVDLIHRRSLLFARWAPLLFAIAWSVFGVMSLLLSFYPWT
jgi:hypothetical protein